MTHADSSDSALPAELQARLDAAGVTDEASFRRALDSDPDLRRDIEAWMQARQQREELQRQPPVVRALLAFLRAESDDAARQVFDKQKALLQPYEAQRILDGLAAQAPEELRARFAARAALLRELRGAVGVVEEPAQTSDDRASLDMQRGTTLINSAQASDGGTATVYNITNITLLERKWTRPAPQPLQGEYVYRRKELDELRALLAEQGEVAIGGRTVGVQGMPGVGKTTLARLLAMELNDVYPDGVIWEVIGPDRTRADQAQDILDRWGLRAVSIDYDPKSPPRFDASAVRALLAEHPRLLIVLDNVWSVDAIKLLREALPPEAHLVMTTRSRVVLESLRGRPFLLDVLSRDDARKLVALRLFDPSTGIPDEHLQWADALIDGVGRHTLALDVALGVLRLEGETVEEWIETAQRITAQLRVGAGFDDLQLDPNDRERHVETVLRYSYDAILDETARRRFRQLGVFAPDAEFSTPYAAALWGCDETTARKQLNTFVNAALLTRGGAAGRWQQHALLRGYALALLHRSGGYEETAAQHAQVYSEAMRTADDGQRFYTMLPEAPQLRHAFAWSVKNDLDRAQRLIGDCAELQAAFGLSREALTWCEQALDAARERGTAADVARAWGSLGNALGRVATLAGENRRERLLAALDAYDEALRFRTPETAPLAYAMTQGNLLNLHRALAEDPDEDRRVRLRTALRCGVEALSIFQQQGHEPYQQQAMRQLQNFRNDLGAEFANLWAELELGPLPEWLSASSPAP